MIVAELRHTISSHMSKIEMASVSHRHSTTKHNKPLNFVLLTLLLIALSCPHYDNHYVYCDATSSDNNNINNNNNNDINNSHTTTIPRQSIYNAQLSSPPSPGKTGNTHDIQKEATTTIVGGSHTNNNSDSLLLGTVTSEARYETEQQSSSRNSINSSAGSNVGYAMVRTDKNDSGNITKSVSVQLGPNSRQTTAQSVGDMPANNNGSAPEIGTTTATTTTTTTTAAATTTTTTTLFTTAGPANMPDDHKNKLHRQQQLSNTRNKRNSVHAARDKASPLIEWADDEKHTIRDKQARYLIQQQLRQYPNIRKMSNNRNKSNKVTTTTTTTSTTTSTTPVPSSTAQLLGNNSQEYEYEEYEDTNNTNDTASSPGDQGPAVGAAQPLPAAPTAATKDTKAAPKGSNNNSSNNSKNNNNNNNNNNNLATQFNSAGKQANKQDNNINNNDNSNSVPPANSNSNNRSKLWKQKFASDKSRLSVSKDTQQQQQQQQQPAGHESKSGPNDTEQATNDSNYALETTVVKKKKKARLVQLPFIRAKNESICIAPAYLEFPNDIIGDKWRSRGLIVIHMAVVVYMFYALALVCERYFMPSLEEFSQRLNLSDDVAGATLMSAGSSAPELFTAILGVFIAKGDVGTGAIVGSAVFNILFVIGICSFVTTTVSHLNWWPVLRDSVFYTFTVLVLILFIYDERVSAYESLAMLALYGVYITIMIHNDQIKEYVTKFLLTTPLTSKLISAGSIDGADDVFSFNVSLMGGKTANSATNCNNNNMQQQTMDPIMMDDHMFRAALLVILKHKRLFSCRLRFRSAIQFVVWQIQYKEVKRKRHQRHLQQQQSIEASYIGPEGEDDDRERVTRGGSNSYGLKQLHKTAQQLAQQQQQQQQLGKQASIGSGTTVYNNYGTSMVGGSTGSAAGQNQNHQSISSGQQQRIARYATQSTVSKSKFSLVAEEDLEMWHNPPGPERGRLDYYVWLAKIPCNFVLYHTIPDCTLYPDKYWLTFIISITWTALFSYVMVWMVTLVGFTLGIPDSIMGITFLAAGTSVPDAYSSIHVARMGMADMAVSNSIGSNIFDILIGLSLPWFIQTAIYPGVTATINSRGVIYSVILLFMSLVATIYLFNRYNWTLQPRLGLALLMTYCLFLVLTCMLEFNMFGHVNPPPCL